MTTSKSLRGKGKSKRKRKGKRKSLLDFKIFSENKIVTRITVSQNLSAAKIMQIIKEQSLG